MGSKKHGRGRCERSGRPRGWRPNSTRLTLLEPTETGLRPLADVLRAMAIVIDSMTAAMQHNDPRRSPQRATSLPATTGVVARHGMGRSPQGAVPLAATTGFVAENDGHRSSQPHVSLPATGDVVRDVEGRCCRQRGGRLAAIPWVVVRDGPLRWRELAGPLARTGYLLAWDKGVCPAKPPASFWPMTSSLHRRPTGIEGNAPSPVEVRVVAAARLDSYATFFSDATVAAAGRRAATREGMWT
jgi:hypothetical protein